MESKEEIRKRLLSLRNSMDSEILLDYSNRISDIVLSSDLYKSADVILLYSSLKKEVNTNKIINACFLDKKEVYFPKVHTDALGSMMDFYKVNNESELENGYMGIKEPVKDEKSLFSYTSNSKRNVLMLLPGVAFSMDFNRIGYGKAYYDTYLMDKPNIIKCGVCYSFQLINEINVQPHDILLDCVVTEDGFIKK